MCIRDSSKGSCNIAACFAGGPNWLVKNNLIYVNECTTFGYEVLDGQPAEFNYNFFRKESGSGIDFSAGFTPVSYTHLRAHETVLDLVCRLLLEKKKHFITKHHYNTKLRNYNLLTCIFY